MVQRLPDDYVFDPEDPRAPAVEQWERMSADERARVVAMLPPHIPLASQFAEEQRRREDEQHRREDAERALVEARAEIERLKKGLT